MAIEENENFAALQIPISVIKIGFGFDLFENIGKPMPLVMKYVIAKTHLFFLRHLFQTLNTCCQACKRPVLPTCGFSF